MLTNIIFFLNHIDLAIISLVQHFGCWTYVILFAIIFLENGFILTPFLPGESLLFALGTLTVKHVLSFKLTFIYLSLAALLGGFINYFQGYYLGHFITTHNFPKIKNYLHQTQIFFEYHGGKSIFLARLLPIIRTYTPFIAGMVKMKFIKFSLYNILSAVLWIAFFLIISYFFGNIAFVQKHFSIVIIVIILISIIPAIWKYIHYTR